MNYYNSIYPPEDFNGDGFSDIFYFVNNYNAKIGLGCEGNFNKNHDLSKDKFAFQPKKIFTLKFKMSPKDKIVAIIDNNYFMLIKQ